MMRPVVAVTLALLTIGVSPAWVAQQQGTIRGRATDEADRPYTNYSVQLVDLTTNQVSSTAALDANGLFSFTNVPVDNRYLVQLFSVRENRVVCTEGPYALTSPDQITQANVEIDCDKVPAVLWLAAAGAGIASGIIIAVPLCTAMMMPPASSSRCRAARSSSHAPHTAHDSRGRGSAPLAQDPVPAITTYLEQWLTSQCARSWQRAS